MTAKLLKRNGEYIHMPAVQAITDDNLADSQEIVEREKFEKSIAEKFGPETDPIDFANNAIDIETAHTPLYEDNHKRISSPTPDLKDTEL